MAYSENLAERVRQQLSNRTDVVERKMFGGRAFMVRGHMCSSVVGDELIVLIEPAAYEGALKEKHVREMNFTGKPLRGMVASLSPASLPPNSLANGSSAGFSSCSPCRKRNDLPRSSGSE